LSALTTMFAAQPVSTVLPPPNPSTSGAPNHSATGSAYTAASGTNASSLSATATLSCAATDNCILGWIVYEVNMNSGYGAGQVLYSGRTVTYGTQALNSVGPLIFANVGQEFVVIEPFAFQGTPATGSHTVTATVTAPSISGSAIGSLGGVSIVGVDSYNGVVSVQAGTGSNVSGSGTALSTTCSSTTSDLAIAALVTGAFAVASTIGSLNHTALENVTWGSTSSGWANWAGSAAITDITGATSVTFSATGSYSSEDWGGLIVNLVGAGTTPIGSTSRFQNTSTTNYNVSSGTNVLPASFFATGTSGQVTSGYSWVASTQTLTITNAGTYVISLNFVEAACTTVHMIRAAIFHNGSVVAQGDSTYVSATFTNYWTAGVSFTLYLNAGDTIQPGYWCSNSISSLLTGESTGSLSYFVVSLANCGTVS
jgi:hypothetical protein